MTQILSSLMLGQGHRVYCARLAIGYSPHSRLNPLCLALLASMFSNCGMPALYIYYGFVWVAVLLVRWRTTGVLFSFLVRDFSAFLESESMGTFDSKTNKIATSNCICFCSQYTRGELSEFRGHMESSTRAAANNVCSIRCDRKT